MAESDSSSALLPPTPAEPAAPTEEPTPAEPAAPTEETCQWRRSHPAAEAAAEGAAEAALAPSSSQAAPAADGADGPLLESPPVNGAGSDLEVDGLTPPSKKAKWVGQGGGRFVRLRWRRAALDQAADAGPAPKEAPARAPRRRRRSTPQAAAEPPPPQLQPPQPPPVGPPPAATAETGEPPDAAVRARLRAAGFKAPIPPETLPEALDWPARYLSILPDDAHHILLHLFEVQGLELSTHYSGIGCAETIVEYLAKAVTCEPQLSCYHACDLDQDCLAILMRRKGQAPIRHIFQDICRRFQPQAIAAVDTERNKALQEHQKNSKSAPLTVDAGFQARASEILRADGAYLGKDFCLVHRCVCPVFDPPAAQSGRPRECLRGNMSGPVCIDFSRQNLKAPGVLGRSGVAYAAWLRERQILAELHEEDFVYHECVPQMPAKERLSAALPRHLVVAWPASPLDYGVGVRRPRTFTLALAPWLVQTMIPIPRAVCYDGDSQSEEKDWENTVMCTVGGPRDWFGVSSIGVDGLEFYCASEGDVQKHLGGKSGRNSLTPGDYHRLIGYEQQLMNTGGAGDMIVNLTQSADWAHRRINSKLIPTLMRKCCSIWSSRHQRSLLPQEALLTQGFASMDLPGITARLKMPFDILPSKENLYSCAGNGINMFAGGAVLTWLLSCFQAQRLVRLAAPLPQSRVDLDESSDASTSD